MKLSELALGSLGKITKIGIGNKAYRQRLIAMGLLPGTQLSVSRIAPLGDPVEINVRGFSLTLRKHEADIIQLEKISNANA